MDSSIVAAFGAAIAVGIAGSEVLKHFMGNGKQSDNGWRSKIEALVEQQLKCLEDHQKQSTESMQMIVLIEHQMAEHEKRESQAWRDIFELVRKLKNET